MSLNMSGYFVCFIIEYIVARFISLNMSGYFVCFIIEYIVARFMSLKMRHNLFLVMHVIKQEAYISQNNDVA